ncbi:MAG: NUDIX domain-containing protein [Crocinitomicaceae bacterium]|nr:NUDIX domain-containing protein [Crocinitomicaceae bacterium]
MGQKYKVFTDKGLIHINESPKKNIPITDIEYIKNYESFCTLIDSKEIQIVCGEVEERFNQLFRNFQRIEAAGGLVINDGKVLMIKRFGFWDLPKGKREEGEEEALCAVREVQEECGVTDDLTIIKELEPTFHIYEYKGVSVLKKTHWFHMETTFTKELIPQLEEDITECSWIYLGDIESYLVSAFPLIRSLLRDFINDN